MCGIAGIFNFNSDLNVNPELLKAMLQSLAHRGPDSTGTFVSNNICMGFTRLALVDLISGDQPLLSNDKNLVLTFNGEIYNFKDIRANFLGRGHKFITNSDAESILALYENNIISPELSLSGMFSYAIYNQNSSELILSRDRVGEKPLFFTFTNEGIIYASEIKAILSALTLVPTVELSLISDFLSLGYSVGRKTAFNNIFSLLPGERLLINSSGYQFQKWWSLPSFVEEDKPDWSSLKDQISCTLEQAVASRLKADVPIGMFLSGGLDSSLILALAHKIGLPKSFKSFTASFQSQSYDESSLACQTSNHFDIENIVIEITPSMIINSFSDIVYHADNLHANPAMIACYFLSQEASKYCKAVLHGGGGDELFLGYITYKADMLATFIPQRIGNKLSFLKYLTSKLPTSHEKLNFKYKAVKFIEGLQYFSDKRHYWWKTIFTDADKSILLGLREHDLDTYHLYEEAYGYYKGTNCYEKYAFADFSVWWQYMGLYQGDAMGMASSLEIRMPFMDHNLISLIAKTPTNYKLNFAKPKPIIRELAADLLPSYLFDQPKSGFHLPLAEWFCFELRDFVYYNLSKERLAACHFLNYESICRLLDEHMNKRSDQSFKLFSLLVLVEWYHQFIVSPSR